MGNERYLTAEQKVERDKKWDEYEKFANPAALERFREIPYQLRYAAKRRTSNKESVINE